nr:hypothetical protein [Tanacetum cinerariifolium]
MAARGGKNNLVARRDKVADFNRLIVVTEEKIHGKEIDLEMLKTEEVLLHRLSFGRINWFSDYMDEYNHVRLLLFNIIMKTQSIDDHEPLVNYDNDNENKDLEYQSDVYFDEVQEDDENIHSNENVVKRGITRFEYSILKEGEEKEGYTRGVGSGVTYKRYFGLPRSRQASDERILLLQIQLDNERREYQEKELLIQNLYNKMSQTLGMAIKCKLWHLKKSTIIALDTVYKIDGKQILHNKELPKDCYKVSIDTSLVDASCIPDVGNNGFKGVKDSIGSFFAWPKDQVVFDPKATPPSTIQMNVENKTAPKLQTKRKNVYVSSDARQRKAKKKRSP